ncbi:60S ribosomal protein L14-like isoform X2 [Strongylocentrotus purpuratus]|uniref:Large ribosomal subunit protein eL14 n=1 Tax=Strongylocentrotus purpuratus TaxID=7668 RepID=A0A7M7HDN8_STRPU|nr:60S ribosomal protein L14-like isoform X2 [Strongylocentrotus purpuratus]|eukprot:XP_011660736.1 PREDICTED: 60S ribosomal protein L14-like isoform X2 [Strongylocentrotus purpuratus]
MTDRVFRRFVEVGRVAYIASGQNKGKLCVIVDVIDQRRALIDGPLSGVKRQGMRFKQLHLTDFVIRIPHSARNSTVRKAWEKDEITSKWDATIWAKKLAAKQKRKQMTDFDRYKLMRAKQKRNVILTREMAKLKKAESSAK